MNSANFPLRPTRTAVMTAMSCNMAAGEQNGNSVPVCKAAGIMRKTRHDWAATSSGSTLTWGSAGFGDVIW